ncbi:MAG: regulatory protein RecX [Saprospiraceae bacterium]
MAVGLTVEEGKSLMRQYCNFQERCHKDVRTKGLGLGFRGENLEEIIAAMISEGLLDEERYARALARGKFRNNYWGRIKIIHALKQHAIPEYCIKKALTEIAEDDYQATLKKLIAAKQKTISSSLKDQQKLITYLLQKGFEYESIQSALLMER